MNCEIVCTRGPMKGKATLEGEGEWQPVTDENGDTPPYRVR